MEHSNSRGQVSHEPLPAADPAIVAMAYLSSPGTQLTNRQRAERLYRMGELAAAADLLIDERIQ